MKNLNTYINESSSSKNEWCLWDYKENGVHEILIWKGNGKDQSDVKEIDEDGYELMNVPFKEIMEYCEKNKDAKVDKWHLDFSNAELSKIPNIF